MHDHWCQPVVLMRLVKYIGLTKLCCDTLSSYCPTTRLYLNFFFGLEQYVNNLNIVDIFHILSSALLMCFFVHNLLGRSSSFYCTLEDLFQSFRSCFLRPQFPSVPLSSASPAAALQTSRCLGSLFQTSWVAAESPPTVCPIAPVLRIQSHNLSYLERRPIISWRTCSLTPSTFCELWLPPA